METTVLDREYSEVVYHFILQMASWDGAACYYMIKTFPPISFIVKYRIADFITIKILYRWAIKRGMEGFTMADLSAIVKPLTKRFPYMKQKEGKLQPFKTYFNLHCNSKRS